MIPRNDNVPTQAVTNPEELAAAVRRVAAAVDAGFPLSHAWERALPTSHEHQTLRDSDMVAWGDPMEPPASIVALTQPIPRPSVRRMVSDLPSLVARAWHHERQRSQRDTHQRSPSGLLITHVINETPAPLLPVTMRWWRSRRSTGHTLRRAATNLCVALRVSAIVGAAPIQMLTCLADSIDAQVASENDRTIARAGPQASSRILGVLPLVGVVGARIMGADPLNFFASSVAGALVGAAGVGLMIAGVVVTRRMVNAASHWDASRVDAAVVMDVAAACLLSGAPIPTTIRALGQAYDLPSVTHVADCLLRGDPWWPAWKDAPAEFLGLAQVLRESWEYGVSAVPGLEAAAQAHRRQQRTEFARLSARLGVRLLLPLGLLHLPAFIALGIIPILAHIAGATLG